MFSFQSDTFLFHNCCRVCFRYLFYHKFEFSNSFFRYFFVSCLLLVFKDEALSLVMTKKHFSYKILMNSIFCVFFAFDSDSIAFDYFVYTVDASGW